MKKFIVLFIVSWIAMGGWSAWGQDSSRTSFIFVDGGIKSEPRYYNALANGHASAQFVYPEGVHPVLAGKGRWDFYPFLKEHPLRHYSIDPETRKLLISPLNYTLNGTLSLGKREDYSFLPIFSHAGLRRSLGKTIQSLELEGGDNLVLYLTGHSDEELYHIVEKHDGPKDRSLHWENLGRWASHFMHGTFSHSKLPWEELGKLISHSGIDTSSPSSGNHVKIFSTGCYSTMMHEKISREFFNICTASNINGISKTDLIESRFSQGIWEELRENGPNTSFGSMFVRGLFNDTDNVGKGSLSSFYYATFVVHKYYSNHSTTEQGRIQLNVDSPIHGCLDNFSLSFGAPCPHSLKKHIGVFSQGQYGAQKYNERIKVSNIPDELKRVFFSAVKSLKNNAYDFERLFSMLEEYGYGDKLPFLNGEEIERERTYLREKIRELGKGPYGDDLFNRYINFFRRDRGLDFLEAVPILVSRVSAAEVDSWEEFDLIYDGLSSDEEEEKIWKELSKKQRKNDGKIGPRQALEAMKNANEFFEIEEHFALSLKNFLGPLESLLNETLGEKVNGERYKRMKVHALFLTYFHVLEHFYKVASLEEREKMENLFLCEWGSL